MKRYRLITTLLFIILLGNCDTTPKRTGALVDYIPKDAQLVIKINNWETLKADIKNNAILSAYANTEPYRFFSEKAELLKNLQPTSTSILSINNTSDSTSVYTVITKDTRNLFVIDSIKNTSIEILHYNNVNIKELSFKNEKAYAMALDSLFIASTSKQQLEAIIDGETEQSASFKKVFDIKQKADLEILTNTASIEVTDSVDIPLGAWASIDIAVLPNALMGTGVVLSGNDSIPQLLPIFKDQIAQENKLATVIPTDALSGLSFTYNASDKFATALAVFQANTAKETIVPILESTNELGTITLEKGAAISLSSLDANLTMDALSPFITETSSLRAIPIYSFSEPKLFTETFSPLILDSLANFMIQLDNFFVFTPTEELANQLIIAYQNKDVLSETSYFKNAQLQLSNTSSILIYKMKGEIPSALASFFKGPNASEIKKNQLTKYPLALLQLNYDRDSAHIAFVCEEVSSEKGNTTGRVSQQTTIVLDNDILGQPQFFSNYKTKTKDIVVQDVTNTFHLYTATGKLLWSKKLDNPILGGIEEVDLLRNGKKQIAFTTSKKLYVLDRNGAEVGPFPITFNDAITQPLAVFDYDNNRKYRFVIVQDQDVLLFDSKGKIVKGFTFKNTTSSIIQPPKHIRLNNKDYILIPEENGKLNILSRVGKSRVLVSDTFLFSSIPVTQEGTNFVVITKDNKKVSISQSGKTTTKTLAVSQDYWFTTLGNVKVTLDDNLLRINSKLVELPFGIYSKPQLFSVKGTAYISVTETQENKVYVYTKSGTLLEGFPVYGTTQAVITSVTNKRYLLTKASSKEVLVYGF